MTPTQHRYSAAARREGEDRGLGEGSHPRSGDHDLWLARQGGEGPDGGGVSLLLAGGMYSDPGAEFPTFRSSYCTLTLHPDFQ
jgi:hypothetical protein